MKMTPVESSHIKSIGYDADTKVMRVEYTQATYEYRDVQKEVYEQIMSADSKGRALKEAVSINGFAYKRVEG